MPAFGPSLLFGLGEGAILPIIPLMARDLGASVPMAALVVALISIGSLLNNIPASLITMRWGERWAIVAAGIWSGLGMALCVLTAHLGLFAAGCFMVGMSQAVYNLARQSYMTEAVPLAYRARALSTLGGVMRIGMFIGPFLGAAAVHAFGLSAAYAVGIAGVLGAAAIGARVPDLEPLPVPLGQAPAATTIVSTLRDHRHVFLTLGIGVVLVSAVRASRQVVIPLWADHLMLAPALASLIYGLAGGIDMLVFYPAGKVMDHKGRGWVAVPSMLIMGMAMLLMPFTSGFSTLLLVSLAIGFGNGIGSGMIMTLGADHSPRHGRAHFLGVWRLMSDIGSSCGPALLSFLAGSLSLAAGIVATGIIAFAAAGSLAYWIPKVQRSERSSNP
ncbi:MFS family permease [Pseudomonas citronellolis]|uniref:MFS transporter n=1 Tax=Pseudomonas citronellolis TaxID=53408 RepID=UPI00209CA7BB|nr:MFS family permease [Pseudomonas citronellolis]MCP1667843.1 MFS family permease [Pseudomonas citronellolis]MCP1699061.1 MFS family permease [Pseudomonas citronellolis]MCP1704950.1 MFS family permease [Pseudomonas citronellolis]MCP1799624.1 MFS family permease [Pseudomonas citronellolis]